MSLPSALAVLDQPELAGLSQSIAHENQPRLRNDLNPAGTHVVAWIQSARRLTDNWMILTAQRAAAKLGLPLVVYQGLDGTYPYSSPRGHTALLSGMKALSQDAVRLGVTLIQTVVRPGTQHARLIDRLSVGAACVVTDANPTAGIGARTDRVERRLARLGVPLWRVESLSLTPASLSGQGTHQHRRRLVNVQAWADLTEVPWVDTNAWAQDLAEDRVDDPQGVWLANTGSDSAVWPPCSTARVTRDTWGEPDAIVDLVHQSMPLLACPHVFPVPATLMTETDALLGLDRFIESGGLDAYGSGAMNPAAEGSHSTLSAALHFGHVSPGRLLRHLIERGVIDTQRPPDALASGPRRWLDQVWTRRDISIHWAQSVGDVTRPDLVPQWAQRTLNEHEIDRTTTPIDPGDTALETGTTGDALWDATMRELRETGRIHPYARMLWGKMILEWSPSWRVAHERLFRLNDTWAIDGRDPISAVSLLWVLGLGDQPFPERARWGIVRPMLTRSSGKKFKSALYIQRVSSESLSTSKERAGSE